MSAAPIADDIGTLKIEDIDLPPLGADEVRMRMRAAAVNFPDILTVQGKYQHKPELPFMCRRAKARAM